MIKNMSKEELEILSYADLAELILNEETKPLNTAMIFKKICELLEYDDDEFANKIGDFYTSLATDKRFVFLKTNEWNLREKHPVDIVMDEDEDEEETEDIEDVEEELEEENEDDIDLDNDDLTDDDDLEDLSIMSDEEMEDN